MRSIIFVLDMLLLFSIPLQRSSAKVSPRAADAAAQGTQFRVTVTDAEAKLPIELARVDLRRDGRVVAQGVTNPAGQVLLRDIPTGDYTLVAWFVGYRTYNGTVHIDPAHLTNAVALIPEGSQQPEGRSRGREAARGHTPGPGGESGL